jgi:HEAT repeat protein
MKDRSVFDSRTTQLRLGAFLACAAAVSAQTPVDKAWSILNSATREKSHEKRARAIHALGLITGNSRARALVETALTDEKPEVRAIAADVIGIMGAKESVPKLKAAIKDPATSVVFAAANSLLVLGDPAAYEIYFAVLTGQKKSGDALLESQVKMLKDPKALGQVGLEVGVGFIPFGGVSYKVFKMTTADAGTPVRAAAAGKLVNDPDPKSRQALADATRDEKWLVRAAAIGALARQRSPAALKAIVPLLDDETEIVRFNAAAAVIQLSSASPNSPLSGRK